MNPGLAGTAHDSAVLAGLVGGFALGFVFGVLTGFGFGIAATVDPPPITAPDPAIVDDATRVLPFPRRALSLVDAGATAFPLDPRSCR